MSYALSYVTVLLLGFAATPPLLSNVTVCVFAVHCAESVCSPSIRTVVSLVTNEPPVIAVNHPLNVYPIRLTVGNVPYALSYVTFLLLGSAVTPKLKSKKSMYVFGIHCAKSMTLPFSVAVKLLTDAPAAYDVPDPLDCVFHPLNVYPMRVNPFGDKFFASS